MNENSLPANILLCTSHSSEFIKGNRQYLDSLMSIWTGEYYYILKKLLDHYDVYGEPMGVHIVDSYDTDSAGYNLAVYVSDKDAYQRVGKEFIAASLQTYVSKSMLLAALPAVAKKANRGDMGGAWEYLDKVRKETPTNKNHIIDENSNLFEIFLSRYSEDAQDHLREMTYGIDMFDKTGLRPMRGTLGVFLAEPEIGKTAIGCHFTHVNAKRGRKVLYVNLEGPGEVIAGRIVLAATGINYSKTKNLNQQMKLIPKSNGYLERMEWTVFSKGQDLSSLSDEEIEKYTSEMKSLAKNFRVLTYPPSTLTAEALSVEIERMADDGWCPDIVILDHLAHIKLPSSHEAAKFTVDAAVSEFLSVAVRLNLSFEVFHQPSVYGEALASGRVLTFSEHSALSKAVKVPASRAVTMQATNMERRFNLIRVTAEKNRRVLPESVSGHHMLISTNPSLGKVGNFSTLWKAGKAVNNKDLPESPDDDI